ncbi:MAG: TRAP transporter permease [Pseudomonadota bacterium]|nr:TRAP transporter permease [Pseudomonadota bacterium]
MSQPLSNQAAESVNLDSANTSDERVSAPIWVIAACAGYVFIQLLVLNFYPVDAWIQRILHLLAGLGIGAFLFHSETQAPASRFRKWLALLSLALSGCALASYLVLDRNLFNASELNLFTGFYLAALICTLVSGWRSTHSNTDLANAFSFAVLVGVTASYLVEFLDLLQFRAGAFPTTSDAVISIGAMALLLEMTRRTTGLAMVIIAAVFVLYAFVGPWMPGILHHDGYDLARLTTYLMTDNGILGPTLGVSATYLILFIVFAAFLQASGAGDYFVKLAFAVAGHKKGGPAKVAVIASGLMGTINGSSAGNVVSTGAFTIPLMKKVGYQPKVAGAIEAAASSGGQILPPIMGAGAFIMADVTGIPYTDIVLAATIPGILYFLSVFFMVDFEASKLGMKGLSKDELPNKALLLRQLYLFSPIIILIVCLVLGYSVIRAGTLSGISVIVVSWLGTNKMGLGRIFHALALAGKMAIPLLSVCATAGIIVGIISLTGVGLRFSTILLAVADNSTIFALIFAMLISVVLGMGMPTTAAYAVAAAVVAPGLVQLGLEPLVAHFFVFFFAVMSAITPPVALAAFAGAAIAGSNSMQTGVQSFKIGISAFIVPFIFCFNPALLMQGSVLEIAMATVTAVFGIYLLSAAVQGWFISKVGLPVRALLMLAALLSIAGGWQTDLAGIALFALLIFFQKYQSRKNELKAKVQ